MAQRHPVWVSTKRVIYAMLSCIDGRHKLGTEIDLTAIEP
jgi:hypothetical protein